MSGRRGFIMYEPHEIHTVLEQLDPLQTVPMSEATSSILVDVSILCEILLALFPLFVHQCQKTGKIVLGNVCTKHYGTTRRQRIYFKQIDDADEY